MRCVAFCTAESYKLFAIAGMFKAKGYAVRQYRKVVYVKIPLKSHVGEAFIFSYGCIVIWGLRKHEELELVKQLNVFAINPLPTIESDRFVFRKGERTEMYTHERLNADIITLDSDSAQLKLAISYGLAQSIQLESYEAAVQKCIDANASFPQQLLKKGKITLSQKAITQRMGEIFIARSFINLNSDFLDAPEYFWEYPNFEDYYTISKRFLDIPRRVSSLNQKLNVLHELFEMLTGQLQHWHSNLLEIIIILLIFVEIAISLFSFKW